MAEVCLRTDSQPDALADGVGVWPIATGKGFIDQSDLLAFGVVGIDEKSAADERSLENGEIGRGDAGDFCDRRALGIERAIFDGEGQLKMPCVHGETG